MLFEVDLDQACKIKLRIRKGDDYVRGVRVINKITREPFDLTGYRLIAITKNPADKTTKRLLDSGGNSPTVIISNDVMTWTISREITTSLSATSHDLQMMLIKNGKRKTVAQGICEVLPTDIPEDIGG